MNLDAGISKPIRDAQKALSFAARIVATAPATPSARLDALQKMADHLRQYVRSGWLNPASVVDEIFEVAELHGLTGEPGSHKEAAVMQIAMYARLGIWQYHSTNSRNGRRAKAGVDLWANSSTSKVNKTFRSMSQIYRLWSRLFLR